MKKKLYSIPMAIACLGFAGLPAQGAKHSVAEFDPKEAESLGWRVVDDGVMGGLSKGNLKVSKDGVLNFKGKLSLENNGGFSSLRTEKLSMDLGDAEGLVARVKGDGRTYQIRFSTDARFRGMEVSFMAEFPTTKGKWTEVKIPFDDFTGSFRGMKLKDQKFNPAKISRLGLLLGDKKAGPFELQVDWIRTYGAKESGSKDVVALALADGRFKVLATALTEAKLVKVLQGKGPFTVFAPTDEAFAKLPKGTVESLLKPENREKLQAILKYHVVPGAVDLSGALKAGSAKTVLGEPVKIAFSKGKVRVNDASLVDADIEASNGVIHVIDSVILPPEPKKDLASVAKRAGKFKTLLAAIEAAGLSDALAGDSPLTILAPTDEAFKALPKGTVESLLKPENRNKLREILMLHAVNGKVSAGDALNAGSAKALNGDKLGFTIDKGLFKVNGATILKTDISCDNGVIHVIDKVLLPAEKSEACESCTSCEQTAMAPADRIQAAIDKGVPIFNRGDHAKCAEIYEACLVELAKDEQMDSSVRQAMGSLIERIRKIEDATERAWMFRQGLDHIHAAVSR
ncbi:CIA30 family protein [Haloferula rosea]|uniref:CIA30 family protein n=1 Tax=Haloferula rosea TaxID=490093 RepID=A0A934RDA5_9BACT|nr:CIA30 family protein [Haloferula rosea]MBK1828460.1 CIA30 family protein [Haloferula rosea]